MSLAIKVIFKKMPQFNHETSVLPFELTSCYTKLAQSFSPLGNRIHFLFLVGKEATQLFVITQVVITDSSYFYK